MIKLIEKSNFDDIEKAVKYYYNKWYYSDMSYDDIASDLKRLGHSDDFIDAVLDGISERYEDEEDYELDESIECGLDYINSMNEEAVKQFHYGNSGESRRKETADRFGFDFTPDDHMITCKDGKVINIQIGKKYRCTSCNNQRVEIVDIDELFDDGSAMLDVAWRNKRYSVASTQIYESVLREKNVEIEVKHEGILEVPEGKNVDDLPFSHFEKLAKKKGLSKIIKALNNLQVWNKNDDKKLSKWAGDMIDKLNKKLKKDEAVSKRRRKSSTGKSNSVGNFLDKQIESGNIDEKQVTVVYDKNNNIMWLGKAGFYPLYLSGIEYRSSGYDKDHPHEFWINARSYTEPFEENLSVKDVKRVNNRIGNRGAESMKEDYITVNGIQYDEYEIYKEYHNLIRSKTLNELHGLYYDSGGNEDDFIIDAIDSGFSKLDITAFLMYAVEDSLSLREIKGLFKSLNISLKESSFDSELDNVFDNSFNDRDFIHWALLYGFTRRDVIDYLTDIRGYDWNETEDMVDSVADSIDWLNESTNKQVKEFNEGCHRKRKKKKLKKENSYGYVHDEDEAKLSTTQRKYLSKRGWEPVTVDDKLYYTMDFQGKEPCEIYIDEWGNCYLVMFGYDLTPTDMFYTITETNTNVIDDLITLGNTITSTGDIDSSLSVFFG